MFILYTFGVVFIRLILDGDYRIQTKGSFMEY